MAMQRLISASSDGVADQIPGRNETESTYTGFGFLVDRAGRFPPTFEFMFVLVWFGAKTTSRAGATGSCLFTSAPSLAASEPGVSSV